LLQYDFFSDHSVGITMPLIFSVLKNNSKSSEIFIEKHVKMDDDVGPDSTFSITYDKLTQMIQHISRIDILNLNNGK
jgi:sialic acid synthase SpsE